MSTASKFRFQQLFRVDRNTDFCRMPHPNFRGGKTLPEKLLAQGFSDLGWDEHKRIYLPATEKFQDAPYIMEEVKSPRVKRPRIAIVGDRLTRARGEHGRKLTKLFDHDIDEGTRDFLLEQARARIEAKMLPSFCHCSATFHGTKALPITVICDSITGGPKLLNGSYVTIELWDNRGDVEAKTLARVSEIVGRGHEIHVMRWTYVNMLEHTFQSFPWHWTHTKSFHGFAEE